MRVKICGITRVQDVNEAVKLGAWALGFNFVRTSPRFLTPHLARELALAVPEGVLKFGVFADNNEDEIEAIRRFTGITHVQLHGDEPPALAAKFGKRAIKVLRPTSTDDLPKAKIYDGVAAFLIDANVPGQLGGTGKLADWDMARRLKAFGPVILAGGINGENVADAMATVEPFAVDVCSGVESAPGEKDPEKLAALFAAIRRREGVPS